MVFNRLTDAHAVVSNYPGTTVEVLRGKMKLNGKEIEVIDTPGMYALLPITAEERVARRVLLTEKPYAVLQVVDAKNLERMMSFTLQLIESGLPLVLQLNMMDEAEMAGIDIDTKILEDSLGVPVVPTVATSGWGMVQLRERLAEYMPKPGRLTRYDEKIESALNTIEKHLTTDYGLTPRAIGLLLLQGDLEIEAAVKAKEADYTPIRAALAEARSEYNQPLSYVISIARQKEVRRLLSQVVKTTDRKPRQLTARLSRAMMHPVTGTVILLLFLYFGLYQFVGVFGAGVLVGFFEETVFGRWINPWAVYIVEKFIPWPSGQSLLAGEYGVITLGLTYAFALILPIVGTFFIMFSIVEDSGYLPRLAMLIDRVFKGIGLSGRAVIPMVVGFGCDTMATVVTRTQETKRERVITTLLLALAIPCSAQLGVIFAILSGSVAALFIWGGVVLAVFLAVGFLAARIIPGKRASFYMEVPPLRLPILRNVISKTTARMQWYFMEIMPVFILVSVLLWAGDISGVLGVLGRWLQPVVNLIGLPSETANVFLYGFFRRDFGAAGLYDLHTSGILTGIPLVVSAVTLTLFVPCVAQFVVMLKERGVKTAVAIAAFIFPFAFLVGFILNRVLTGLGVVL